MDRVTFDHLARRTAGLLDRRSLLGGLSASLVAGSSAPLSVDAKKHKHKHRHKKSKACKKRMKLCRSDLRDDVCEGNGECISDLNRCCKKACQSTQKAIDCCENAGWCL